MKRRNWHIWLVVIALAIRFLVPPGFMVGAADAAGAPTIVICTANGFKQVAIGADGQPVEQQVPTADEPPCFFAASATAPLPEPVQPLVSERWIDVERLAVRASLVGSATGHDWEARAPPGSRRST